MLGLVQDTLVGHAAMAVFRFAVMDERKWQRLKKLPDLLLLENGTGQRRMALLAALTLGTMRGVIVCKVFDQLGTFGTITCHFPALEMLLFGAALLLVQRAFSAGAARWSQTISLMERIKAVDGSSWRPAGRQRLSRWFFHLPKTFHDKIPTFQNNEIALARGIC